MSQSETQNAIFNCAPCKDSGWLEIEGRDGRPRAKRCVCLERELKMRRLRFAEVPTELAGHTINSFDLSLYSADSMGLAAMAKRAASNYVKNFTEYRAMGKGLYLYGNTPGSGKTRLAVSIGNALWNKYGVSVGFKTVIGLMSEIKATWSLQAGSSEKTTQEKLITSICDADVFIFDDIGTERPTAWVEEMLYHIIDTRKTRLKPTIFTSNCEAEDLSYYDKLIQRVSAMAIPIKFPEESVRNSLTMAENERLQLKLLGG